MVEMISALLVYDREDTFDTLKHILESQCITTKVARSCGEALFTIWGKQPPHLVFTDVQLTDGNWSDVISLAARCRLPVNVIVVSRQVDVRFYVEAIERGAFDFMTPPFEVSDATHVIRSAAQNALSRRHPGLLDRAKSAGTFQTALPRRNSSVTSVTVGEPVDEGPSL
jgi:DNA-binding NtrC family response regulator